MPCRGARVGALVWLGSHSITGRTVPGMGSAQSPAGCVRKCAEQHMVTCNGMLMVLWPQHGTTLQRCAAQPAAVQ